MGRSLSPLLRQELENLDKDAESRRSAMRALKSYAKHLDSKSLPHFLAEVSDNKPPGLPSGEFTISLYEVLARVHGRNIVPQIGNIMSTIMRTLTSSGGSFPLHQACAKVVPAIARYGIDPSTPDEEKAGIIASLCKPLCNALMCNQDGAASGAALCLKALVESNNWRLASGETVNEVCLKVAGALHDSSTQSNAHMGLAMALVKNNGLIAEAYARSLVRSGLQILEGYAADSNSQKRLSAIQMINFLMKFVDPRSISSELSKVVDVMEQCQNDRMPFVRGAAFEASQTAKNIAAQKGSRHEVGASPMVGSNFRRRREKSPCRSLWSGKDSTVSSDITASPVQFQSPESQVVDSSIMYDSTLTESPTSIGQSSCNFDRNQRANRRLWNNDGAVDVSLKDGLFVRVCSSSKFLEDDLGEVCDGERTETNFECTETFSGFVSASPNSAMTRETTPSPQNSQKLISIDDVRVYTTPRRLLRSLQSSYDFESAGREEQLNGNSNNLLSPHMEQKAQAESAEEMQSQHPGCEAEELKDENRHVDSDTQCGVDNVETFLDDNHSRSSTMEGPENTNSKVPQGAAKKDKDTAVTKSRTKTMEYKTILTILSSMITIVLAIIVMFMRVDNYEPSFDLVPT